MKERIKSKFRNMQNHSVAEPGKHLWRLCSPDLQLRAGSATRGCSGLPTVVFWISAQMEALQPLWATFSSWTLMVIFFSLVLNGISAMLWFVPIVSCPFTGHHREELFHLLHCSHQALIHTGKIPPWAFSYSGWIVPALSVSFHMRDASVP